MKKVPYQLLWFHLNCIYTVKKTDGSTDPEQTTRMCRMIWSLKYIWLSLSRTRLSRITAYLEVKILSLPKHENLTTSKKYCGKEEKLLLRSNFSSFPQYFRYISNVKSPITYIFVKCGCSNYFFLSSENLICRGTDISKCFRESLGIRDNESRLYIYLLKHRKIETQKSEIKTLVTRSKDLLQNNVPYRLPYKWLLLWCGQSEQTCFV